MTESAKTAVKKALEPKPLVVPADTIIAVVLDQTISSKTNHAGDKFSATIEEALGRKPDMPKGLENLEQLPQRFEVFDADAAAVKAFIEKNCS